MKQNTNSWYWYSSLEECGRWNLLPFFSEDERIPRLKEFILQLYLLDDFSSIDIKKDIHNLYRKLDQIWRNECNKFGKFNPTLEKDINYLLGKPVSIYSKLYFDSQRTPYQKELVLLRAVNETIQCLEDNNMQSILSRKRKEEGDKK